MHSRRIAPLVLLAVSLGVAGVGFGGFAGSASAQMARTNQPFQFQNRGGAGESVGMSNAYRQVILNQELRGMRPENLARDRSGNLLDVERRDGQAFVSRPAGSFAVRNFDPTRIGAFGSVGGFGMSIGYGAPAWPLLLAVSSRGAAGAALAPYPNSAPSIDAWIHQMNTLYGAE
jgi:hypothetical protein